MGAAASVNTTDLVTKAINKVSSEIIQKSASKQSQEVQITIKNVKGDVNIIGGKIYQIADVNTKSLFQALNNVDNKNKIKEEIESLAQSIVSGLNIAQASVSTTSINRIIENCNTIAQKSISKCSQEIMQDMSVNIENVGGDVNVTDLGIKQIANTVSACVVNSSGNTSLINETDSLIKQLSSSKAEGLDLKWLLIAGAVGLGLVSTKALPNMTGPLIIAGGVYGVYQGYKEAKETKTTRTFLLTYYLSEKIPSLSRLKIIDNFNPETQSLTDVGNADVYEYFNKKLILYSGGDKNQLLNLKPDTIDYSKMLTGVSNSVITVTIPGSTKFADVKINIYTKATTTVQLSNPPTANGIINTLYIVRNTENNTLHFYEYINNEFKKFTEEYTFPNTTFTIIEKNSVSAMLKNPLSIAGIVAILLGIGLMIFKKS